jgi:hypothetical protein
MKTLIAALALSVAASTAAFAGNDDPRDAGIAFNLQHEAAMSDVQVSGFTGVSGVQVNLSEPRDGGIALNLQEAGYSGYGDTMVSGFTGIQAATSYEIEHYGLTR